MDITTALAASRLVAQQRALEVTANNIANANTPGYRAERMQFADWIDPGAGTSTVPGGRAVTYTQDRATWREQQQGTLTHTGNTFDLAISGDGYFTIDTKSGPRLTRNGRFGMTPGGTLADANGNAVLDTTGKPIQFAPSETQISIAGDGSVSSENGPLGKIGVVQPEDPMKLQAEGASDFVSGSATSQVTAPGVVQGAVEDSNVQPVMEITRMMDTERQFQFATQLVQAESDRQQNAIEKLLPPSS